MLNFKRWRFDRLHSIRIQFLRRLWSAGFFFGVRSFWLLGRTNLLLLLAFQTSGRCEQRRVSCWWWQRLQSTSYRCFSRIQVWLNASCQYFFDEMTQSSLNPSSHWSSCFALWPYFPYSQYYRSSESVSTLSWRHLVVRTAPPISSNDSQIRIVSWWPWRFFWRFSHGTPSFRSTGSSSASLFFPFLQLLPISCRCHHTSSYWATHYHFCQHRCCLNPWCWASSSAPSPFPSKVYES